MKGVVLFAAVVLAASAVDALAIEICYGPAADNSVNPTASTVFACPIAGSHTVNELAASGWRIVRITPVGLGGAQTAAQLIIQGKPDPVFKNGFEI